MNKKRYYTEPKIGPLGQKILVLLLGGASLMLTNNPKIFFRIIENMAMDFNRINRYSLARSIRKLYQSKLLDAKDNEDGSTSIVLTRDGKRKALVYHIDTITIPKMDKWDKQWRIVMFDIPERFKKARDALSLTLKRMGFHRLQKSVFLHPFECKNELDFVIEFWNVRSYVRTALAIHVDNALHLKTKFGIFD